MKEFQLSCSFDVFKETVQTQIEKFETLQRRQINSIEELQTARKDRRDCYREAIANLNYCFMEENNELVRDFTETQTSGFLIAGVRKSTDTEIKEFRESCKSYINSLKGVIGNASLSDIMVNPDEVDLAQRASMGIEDREIFILQKLSKVSTGGYFDIRWILESNGITSHTYNESFEITKSLEQMGYVNMLGTLSGAAASITTEGIKYLEQLAKEDQCIPKGSDEGYEEVSRKIDEVVEMLVKAGVEREMLFNEMEELKELFLHLNKKNWRQIVMGKLGDLVLAKAAEPDSINAAYQFLTGDHHKLIG